MPDRFGPAQAIGALLKLLVDASLDYSGPDIKDDLRDLRQAYRTDPEYTSAILAFVREIQRALRDPGSYGDALQRKLAGTRRGTFPPVGARDADLRLVIEPLKGGRMKLIAMRHRHDPPGIYALSARRRTK